MGSIVSVFMVTSDLQLIICATSQSSAPFLLYSSFPWGNVIDSKPDVQLQFFSVILYMADYVQWFIREKFLPAIDIEDELEESFAFRERNEGDLDRAPVSKRRVVDMK